MTNKNSQIPQSLLAKLANLKNLSERGGTVHEAQAAAAALQKLLSKHNLSIESLDLDLDGDAIAIGALRGTYLKSRGLTAQRDLLSGLARANYAEMIVLGGTRDYQIIGSKLSLVVIQQMYEYLWMTIKNQGLRHMRDDGFNKTQWTAFVRGAAWSIYQRLMAMKKEAEAETAGSTDIVLVKDARLKQALDAMPDLKDSRTVSLRSGGHALQMGQQYGNTINLNPQIDAKPSSRQLT